MGTAWDVPRGDSARSYGRLPEGTIREWATNQAELSTAYQNGSLKATSATKEGRELKNALLIRIRETLVGRSNFSADEINHRLGQISDHLEDPGLVQNFLYFDVPSSDFMLQFYFAVWDRRIAEVMCYLHNYGKDLKGVTRHVPEDDVWYQMSYFEGMNINERKKSQGIVDFIKKHDVKNATSFGGGNIPERLYGLPKDLTLTVFDDGPVSDLTELFPNKKARENVNYQHEALSHAPEHRELLATQDLVWMHGVSMYLNEKDHREMTGAILCGAALLKVGGYMKYDYLLWTESMRRVIKTQNWPYDPRRPMTIFGSVDEVLSEGMATLNAVNLGLTGSPNGNIRVGALDPEITLVEPWGVTSVRFTIQKYMV